MHTMITAEQNWKDIIMAHLHHLHLAFSKIPYSKKAWRLVWGIMADVSGRIMLMEMCFDRWRTSFILIPCEFEYDI